MIDFFEKQYAAQQDDYEDCEIDLDANENAVEEKCAKKNPIVSYKKLCVYPTLVTYFWFLFPSFL